MDILREPKIKWAWPRRNLYFYDVGNTCWQEKALFLLECMEILSGLPGISLPSHLALFYNLISHRFLVWKTSNTHTHTQHTHTHTHFIWTRVCRLEPYRIYIHQKKKHGRGQRKKISDPKWSKQSSVQACFRVQLWLMHWIGCKAPMPFCRLLKDKCNLPQLNIALIFPLSLYLTLISDQTNCLWDDRNSLSCEKHFSWWHVLGRGKE